MHSNNEMISTCLPVFRLNSWVICVVFATLSFKGRTAGRFCLFWEKKVTNLWKQKSRLLNFHICVQKVLVRLWPLGFLQFCLHSDALLLICIHACIYCLRQQARTTWNAWERWKSFALWFICRILMKVQHTNRYKLMITQIMFWQMQQQEQNTFISWIPRMEIETKITGGVSDIQMLLHKSQRRKVWNQTASGSVILQSPSFQDNTHHMMHLLKKCLCALCETQRERRPLQREHHNSSAKGKKYCTCRVR